MVDVVDRATRSRMMAGIKSRDTKPERLLRSALHRKGFRYRLDGRSLPGRPDLVLTRYRAVVFVHGCFWHRHAGCRYAATPRTRAEFWQQKFDQNVARDRSSYKALLEKGWRVAVVWECNTRLDVEAIATELASWLKGDEELFGLP